jgi:hypothetical protein
MTKFGTQLIDRTVALELATRGIGRLMNLTHHSGTDGFIGFTLREMKRRDVASLIAEQQINEICTMGKPLWFQSRVWFCIGDEFPG